jgi:hypothetical protein
VTHHLTCSPPQPRIAYSSVPVPCANRSMCYDQLALCSDQQIVLLFLFPPLPLALSHPPASALTGTASNEKQRPISNSALTLGAVSQVLYLEISPKLSSWCRFVILVRHVRSGLFKDFPKALLHVLRPFNNPPQPPRSMPQREKKHMLPQL